MKIANIYTIDSMPTRNLIITPDGRLYTFHIAPYRVLNEKDLQEVKPRMPIPMYLKAVGAREFPAYRDGDIVAYGLERECKEERI